MTPTEAATLKALAECEWMTKKDLSAKTGAARRTLYLACLNLFELGLVKVKPSLKDTRQCFYALTEMGRETLKTEWQLW